MKILFIVNPFSGIKNWEKVVGYIKNTWDTSGHIYEVRTTWQMHQGEEFARQAVEDGYDIVAAVGGDGTVNEIARGLIGSETALAVIPAGSGNGFARHFNIPMSRQKAINRLLRPEFFQMDVGEVNGKMFLITCGAGMDGNISKLFNASPRRGLLSYFSAVIRSLLGYKLPVVKIVLEENVIEVEPLFITAANLSQYGGGVQIAPGADPFDGYLDLCIVKRMSPLLVLYHWPKIFTGRIRRIPATTIIKVKDVTIHTEFSEPVHFDGESMEPVNKLKVKIRPKALKIALGTDE